MQKHAARRLHYDLRLQFGPTLKSWAVTRGPSLDPATKRLAMHVEDHPLEYADFEGLIPKGEYGAGAVLVWDQGTWVPTGDPDAGYRQGRLKFRLAGTKLNGGWSLVRLKAQEGSGDPWLLVKERDAFARISGDPDVLEQSPESVLTGRTIEDLQRSDENRVSTPAAAERGLKNRGKRRRSPASVAGARRGALPGFVKPQLATRRAMPPDGDAWLHEIKLDGYRTLARIEDDAVRFFTRNGLDWTARYGRLADAFSGLDCRAALMDGEIIVQDENGVSSFSALQEDLEARETRRLLFYGFDLLHLNGYDLADVSLIDRKSLLADLLTAEADRHAALQFSDHVVGTGAEMYLNACRFGLEGIVSKRRDAPYTSGRTHTWVKTKCVESDDFVIVGFTETVAAGGLAALHLAEPADSGLRYVGKVGTGFSSREAERLSARLIAAQRDHPSIPIPVDVNRSTTTWCDPRVLVEIQYGSRTAEGRLRHAIYKGLRPDKLETPARPESVTARPERLITDGLLAGIWVSNPGREMFEKGDATKLDVALFYARVGDWMLPEIQGRPLSLIRCPSGEQGDCFYQRHVSAGMSPEIGHLPLGSQERKDYLYVDTAAGYLWLAQFGAVEFHPWGCRIDRPEYPDRMIFDLDPDESLHWGDVADAAREVRDFLEDLGLSVFLKTTGGKGLHLVAPLVRRHDWNSVSRFSEGVARTLARASPRRFTSNIAKRQRTGRVFIDYLRNKRGATAVAAYSLRARRGLPVSTPLAWSELADVEHPSEFNYRTVPLRLADGRCQPWKDMSSAARALTKTMARHVGLEDLP